jgi:class 3 adenylate cyclase/TolB-like protein
VATEEIERRLVAILMADVAGYSRLIGVDDEGTLAQLNSHHAELIEPKIKQNRGRIVRTTGDGLLVLFVSAVDALRCAVEIQRSMIQRNAQIPADRQINFRMGVNVGDIVEGASIHGDGINVAARLEALAEPGGICVSSRVQEDAQGSLVRLGIAFEDIGQHQLKNIQHTVRIYRVLPDHAQSKAKPSVSAPPAARSGGPEHSASVQEITVLLADMEGFRGLPERLGVHSVPFMSEYFDLISHHVHAHGGTTAKFIAETVVAFWNGSGQAADACRAAVACQRALQTTHASGNALKARIAINSGTAVVGTVGPSTQRSFAIMGETLNVAAALERACMRYGTKIIIGEETWRLASKQIHVRELDGLLLQGHSAELQIYELLGFVGDEWERPNWLSLYEAGLEAYRARNFSAAIDSFQTLLTINESDKPSQVMIERCSLLLKAQPKGDDDATVATITPRRRLTLPDKPSIAVLAFANLSSDPDQEYVVDGIVEDIITELSRFSELFVIARNSSFQYKCKAVDVRHVGRELGVRYVLEGSARQVGDRIRLSAQLIEAATGTHRWAERYDRTLEDVFAVQDEVVRTIVAIMTAHVRQAEIERLRAKPPNSWQAYDYYLQAVQALASFTSTNNVAHIEEARRLLQQSLAIDPSYARSYAALAGIYVTAWYSPTGEPGEDFLKPAVLEQAHGFARKAVQLDRNLPQAHAALGFVLTSKHQHDACIAAFEKAVSLNPNYVDWRFASALIRAGDSKRAIEVVHAYMRLDPFYVPYAHICLAFAHYMLEQYSQSLPLLRDYVAQLPTYRPARSLLAATLAQMGHPEEARAEAAEFRRLFPSYTISGIGRQLTAFKYPRDDKHFFDGLRKAGLPE